MLLRFFRFIAYRMRAGWHAELEVDSPGVPMAAIVRLSNSDSAATTSNNVDAFLSGTACFICLFSDSQAFALSGLAKSSYLLSFPPLIAAEALCNTQVLGRLKVHRPRHKRGLPAACHPSRPNGHPATRACKPVVGCPNRS